MRFRFPALCALLLMLAGGGARAQYELKSGSFNTVYQGGQPFVANPPATNGQSSSVAPLSGSAGPISDSATLADRYPSNADNTLVLQKASIGSTFAAGVPRYSLGDIITPPLVKADGVTPADANYWRPQPVLPGEIVPGLGILIPVGSVSVSSASTNSTTVTVASVPEELVVGATLLGQPVTRVVGNTVTLAGNASNAVSSATNFSVIPATSFYYSPHAEKVFAHQPGRVAIKWVSRVVDGANYGTRDETFAVSSNTLRPIRTIFWTEGNFDGPKVQITDGRITTVSPVYNNQVPKAVPEEISIPGYSPASPNLGTLSFKKFNGVGQLEAYNVEGRLMVEYLGNVRSSTGTYEWVGSEIVEIKRAAAVSYPSVNLGEEIRPGNGDATLVASPVLGSQQGGASYYGTAVRPDQTQAYYAERDTSPANDPDDGSPLVPNEAFNKVVFYWLQPGDFNIRWPHHQDRYWLRWSPDLADYAHYTVDAAGSTPETGISFSSGILPQLVYQDDPAQAEAAIDFTTQRFHVQPGADQRNRSLLKFSSSNEVWYVTIYSQAEARQKDLAGTSPANPPDADKTVVTVASTAGLEVGMVVSGPGINGTATIVQILNGTQYVLSQRVPSINGTLTYTVQSDGLAAIHATATVGTRLEPPAGHEFAGFISGGTGYYPAGYVNPVVSGVAAGNLGAIIPVNARPGDNVLTVRWFKKVAAPSGSFQNLYVPGKIGRYTVSFPGSTSPEIVIAQGVGTNDLPPAESTGSVYYQNDSTKAGYNPNEEHSLMIGGRAYALRDDLNVTSGANYTSQPCLLLAYTDPVDHRPAMHAYKVQRTNATYNFNYVSTAGTLLVKPYPLPLMPLPLTGSGSDLRSKDIEIPGADDPANGTILSDDDKDDDVAYRGFTFQDRKGFTWVHRGPHTQKLLVSATYGVGAQVLDVTARVLDSITNQTPLTVDNERMGGDPASSLTKSLSVRYRTETGLITENFTEGTTYTPPPDHRITMKLYYVIQDGFFIPGLGSQPDAGTILPFLRDPERSGHTLNLAATGNGQDDDPLEIIYRPAWPEQAAELRVGETLTLPKFGLPQVRGQSSAAILYQQSLAKAATATKLNKTSVTLHDPTREKTIALDAPAVGLSKLPASIATTASQGKIYFQGLPPHLQQRFFLDPLRGAKGTLVFLGDFHDMPAGDDYLDLNLLTAGEEAALKDLVGASDGDKGKWDGAIASLKTLVETFQENPVLAGTFKVGWTEDVPGNQLAVISSPETAVDSYALTATGQGTGFVTMVFGNGRAFTAEGDPVQVKVFKVAPQLYTGDLKVIASSNPLDEQVTLRHSGDFAGKPQDYEFEWRWTTGAASAPAVYTSTMSTRIGNPANGTHQWRIVSDPGDTLPSEVQYAAATPLPLPRSQNVRPTGYGADEEEAGLPAVVLKSESGIDFSLGVPGDIFFSANVGTQDGFVLFVNGTPAVAYHAPEALFTPANSNSGLSPAGLPLQFAVPASYFSAGPNTIEVAVYSNADPNVQSTLDFRLEAATETDAVLSGGVWQVTTDPQGKNTNTAIVGGSPVNPFGGATFVLNDRWFTMRYRPKASADNVLGSDNWSRWMPPMMVEGWVKRVLAAINPFEQRVKDLYNNALNTDVSMLTQAGSRWEGDVALNLDNINDVGLIEIYETVLNRAKSMSIDANTNDPDTNNALILAAGYLNDLYTLLGNEAYADAANPTISIDDQSGSTVVNTSRFSFEGQVATSLDEEMALLRGRDDSASPGVGIAPAYNRLYWNYTRGINGGEAIYAQNYNIREKAGSSTANGVIDEADAQRMFPQGHGDAYGHYLTALTGYYKLLSNGNFTWTPRAEAVTVLGQPVTVDYYDERKFAAAAGNLARTTGQVIALTWRQQYKDDPAAGWSHFRDNSGTNTQTGVTRRQGMDEWVSRGSQGALYHWAVANSMLPVEDNVHSGIQKIDRRTVPELASLPSTAASFQSDMDSANAHLNPLGLSPGAIAFDISPSLINGEILYGTGAWHYEQIATRAVTAINNASGAFNQAASMTGMLRNQEITSDEFNTAIFEEERSYTNQLIDIYGRPYSGDVGPGKLYAQGYSGADLRHWYIVDRPNNFVDTAAPVSFTFVEPVEEADKFYNTLSTGSLPEVWTSFKNLTQTTVTVLPSQWVQYNDVWKEGGLGSRPVTGELQNALTEAQLTLLEFNEAKSKYDKNLIVMKQKAAEFQALVALHEETLSETKKTHDLVLGLNSLVLALNLAGDLLDLKASTFDQLGETLAEFFPKSVGLATDATSGARGAAKLSAGTAATIFSGIAIGTRTAASATEIGILSQEQKLDRLITDLGFDFEEQQFVWEFKTAYRDLVSDFNEIMQITIEHQRAVQNVNNVLARGERVLAARELFRQRAASVIQGYRTRDISFRLFRNEALEQYRSLFDLASRYSYLAAKSYDYETGLLGTPQGKELFSKIVSSRALGEVVNGQPVLSTSSLGDGGLASVMARLNADFSVAEGRLGIHSPALDGTVFSLRGELFRIMQDESITSDEEVWKQTLERHVVSNVMSDPDVAKHCRNIRKADGSPVPGIVIPFRTTIEHGKNFFGLDLAGGDHAFTASNFATKVLSTGISLPGYVGMDAYAAGQMQSGAPASGAANALSATPYVYLIPCGIDYMLAPPLGDTNTLRSWKVEDQALPLPFNLGANDFNSTQFFNAEGTLSEEPWVIRKHSAFRAVNDPAFFYGTVPMEFTNTRLIGRSVWNSQWKIVIPAYTLLNNEQEGLNRFVGSVQDVQLFLRTYSHSGN